jgi:ParB-like chromosome segregation protein Spo0J
MKYETVKIDSLVNDPRNARKHSERNIETLKNSLEKFGQQKPIVVKEDGTVIAGNATLEAARLLGWDEIDIARTDLDGDEAVAFAIVDNRTAELAMWDDIALANQLSELKMSDEDLLEVCGFTSDELDRRLTALGAEQATGDAVQEWIEMPKFEAAAVIHRSIIVHFANDDDVAQFAERLKVNLTPSTKYFWWKCL